MDHATTLSAALAALLIPGAGLFSLGGCKGPAGAGCDPDVAGTICTIAGNGKAAFAGDNGPATQASLYTPQDTAKGPDGQLWVLDFNNYLIRSIDDQGTITTRVGLGLLGDSPRDQMAPDCPALEAKFNHTPNMFFHDGYLYLASWHNSDVKRVELSSMTVSDFAGISKRTWYTGDEGPAITAALDLPSSVAAAPNGDIIVMDQANQVIRNIDASGNIHRMAGTCIAERYDLQSPVCYGGSVGTVLNACPPPATGAPASDKSTYCTNVDAACKWACTPGYAGDGGPALQMRMNQPFGQSADPAGRLAYDAAGNLFFADSGGNRIRKIDTSGMVSTVAGIGGDDGYSGDGGPATAAQLAHPIDLALADDGTIYFTDTRNNCVRKVDPAGTISAVAGDCSSAGKCNEAGSGACFSDTGNTCTADPNICFKGDGGPPLGALLNRPYGVNLDGKKLYIADSYNSRIRVVNLE